MKTFLLFCCFVFGSFSHTLLAEGGRDATQQASFLKGHLFEESTIDCSNIQESFETYLQIATTHKNLLTNVIRRFKSQLLKEDKLSEEDKKNLKEDLLKTLMLLDDTELVLQDKAQYIQMVLPDCLKTPRKKQ